MYAEDDHADAVQEDVDGRQLLTELDELHAIDRRRRLEPRGSAAYASAAEEVDRRSRALIDRLRRESDRRTRDFDGPEGGRR